MFWRKGLAGVFGLGMQEILLILVLALIFFGAEKIPQLARSLGKGMSEFRKAQQEFKEELSQAAEPVGDPHGNAEAFSMGGADAPAGAVSAPSGPAYVICPACQGRTVVGSLYCSQCGRRMTDGASCSLCHRHLETEERFCPNCGRERLT